MTSYPSAESRRAEAAPMPDEGPGTKAVGMSPTLKGSGWVRLNQARSDRAGSGPDRQRVAVAGDGHQDLVAVAYLTGQQLLGQLVTDRGLDQPPQRTRALHRVEATPGQPALGVVADRQREPP